MCPLIVTKQGEGRKGRNEMKKKRTIAKGGERSRVCVIVGLPARNAVTIIDIHIGQTRAR